MSLSAGFSIWLLQVLGVGVLTSILALALHRINDRLHLSPTFRYQFLKVALAMILISPVWSIVVPGSLKIYFGKSSSDNVAPKPVANKLATQSKTSNPVSENSKSAGFLEPPTEIERSRRENPEERQAGLENKLTKQFSFAKIAISLATIYLLGLCISIGRLFSSLLDARRVARHARNFDTPESFCPVFTSPEVSSPVSLGIIDPIILIPEDLTTTLSPSELRMVLAHEGVHITRKDHLFKTLSLLVELLWYFWPLTRKLSQELEAEMEISCDNQLLTSGFFSPRPYGELLLRLASRSGSNPGWAGVGISNSFLARRIKSMKTASIESRACLQFD